MFYVCKKRDDGYFGIMDTNDGVVEYYSPREISNIMRRYNLDINGASIVNGKLRLTVKTPTSFSDGIAEDTDIELPDKPLRLTPVISDDSEGRRFTGFESGFDGLYEGTLRSDFIGKCSNFLGIMLQAYVMLTGQGTNISIWDMCDLDGWDCIGFDSMQSKLNPKYSISVITNPDCVVEKTLRGYRLLDVKSESFGCDIMIGNDIKSHIECSYDNWEEDIRKSEGWKLLVSCG